MRIALATPTLPRSIDDCLQTAKQYIADAAKQGAEIICFPESYIPGYPIEDNLSPDRSPEKLAAALDAVCAMAAENKIAVIMPMDRHSVEGLQNVAYVISATGEIQGYQAKCQLDPSEDHIWVPGTKRELFEVNNVKFGIAICHEGFRYPETVRWAARQGAAIVFHPNCTGSDIAGQIPAEWAAKSSPYYEKATMVRAMENTIFFASVNYCFRFPESASAISAPDGCNIAYQPYGEPGVLVADIDLSEATGLLAKRFKPQALV